MKLERKPSNEGIPAHVNTFSKVANLKLPDSCTYCGKEFLNDKAFKECEEACKKAQEKEEEDISKPSKFEHLMKAACTIKQEEMESRRRKFEKLPAFLKAGVYYTTKLECTRKQDYYPRLFAYELLMKTANREYYQGEVQSACRKYEEVCTPFQTSINHSFPFFYRLTAVGGTSRAIIRIGTKRASTTHS